MLKISLAVSKMLKKNPVLANKVVVKLNRNIHKEITYPKKVVMIISDNIFDFSFINSLLNILSCKSICFKLNSLDDLTTLIVNKASSKGNIDADIIFYSVRSTDVKKCFSLITPTHVLTSDFDNIRNYEEIKELVESKILISNKKITKESFSYSIENLKNNDFYISNIDFIKERIIINHKYLININEYNDEYLNKLMLFFAFLSNVMSIELVVKALNKLNQKNFTCKKKAIFLDLNKTNYNSAIKFITRFKDYKVLVIGWHSNIYEDISWFYNVDFERLLNKNIQKIYCIGVNAYDIATRLKYADFNEKNLIVSPNIDLILPDLIHYNLNLYLLVDQTYEQIIKEGMRKSCK